MSVVEIYPNSVTSRQVNAAFDQNDAVILTAINGTNWSFRPVEPIFRINEATTCFGCRGVVTKLISKNQYGLNSFEAMLKLYDLDTTEPLIELDIDTGSSRR